MPSEPIMKFETCGISGSEKVMDDVSELSKTYPVVEIFHSVQGEGFHSGSPRIFIRFGRCNLRCEWCDTEFDEWTEMTVIEILAEVMRFECKNIVFTGGEPAIHNLVPISNALRNRDYHTSIETNGTIEIPEGLIDWICVSPKDQLYPNVKIKQRTGDELKIVYCGQDLSMYDDLIRGFENLFIQPCYFEGQSVEWNGKNFQETETLVKNNPKWRLSLQTHKWMGIL